MVYKSHELCNEYKFYCLKANFMGTLSRRAIFAYKIIYHELDITAYRRVV